jgi:hypothetical protein
MYSRTAEGLRRRSFGRSQVTPQKICGPDGARKIEFLSKIELVRGEIQPPLYH